MTTDPKRLIVTTPALARALGDPVRTAILEALDRSEASVEEISQRLKGRGIEKAVTTIRHHVDVLKDAGLIELRRTEEIKGGVLKYYAANARLVLHETTPDVEARLDAATGTAAALLADATRKLLREHPELRQVARELRPCPHCNDSHFLEYVVLRVLERGTARAMADFAPVARAAKPPDEPRSKRGMRS